MTLAALVCLGGASVARVLLRYAMRGSEAGDQKRAVMFQIACAVTVGLTVWAAHFLALRALPIEGAVGYDFFGAAGSLALSIGAMLVSVRMMFMGPGLVWSAGAVAVRTFGSLAMHIVAVAIMILGKRNARKGQCQNTESQYQ